MAKVVFTGSANAGKSTLISRLSELGFHTVGETARDVLQELSSWADHSPISTFNTQYKIYHRQLKVETNLPNGEVYLDRGLPDVVAYSRVLLGEVPSYVKPNDLMNRYDKVIICQRMPFQQDGIRIEKGEDEAQRIQDELLRTYDELGHDIYYLPLYSTNKERSLQMRINHLYQLGLLRDKMPQKSD